jgi:hypothetical protein
MDLSVHIHSPIRLHGVVLNWLSTGTTLPLPLKKHIASPLPVTSVRRIVAFISESHMKLIKSLCAQTTDWHNVKAGDI